MTAKKSSISRRQFLSNTTVLTAGSAILGTKAWGMPAYIPNLMRTQSAINGVQLGLITYSFRDMEDQSAEATLQYILESGVNAVELMGSTAESFIGRPQNKMDRRLYYGLMRKE
ncbi:MAG: sugar phosphate isomerase/epimerase, partial [Flavobacteriaceae bacterium]